MGTVGTLTFDGASLAAGVLQSLPAQFSGGFLEYALLFFVLAIVAALLGASGVAGISMTIAKWFIIIFLVLAVVSLVL